MGDINLSEEIVVIRSLTTERRETSNMINYTNTHYSVSYIQKGYKVWTCNGYRCNQPITIGSPVVWTDKHNTQYAHPATYCYHPACIPAAIRPELMKNKYYNAFLRCSDLLTVLSQFPFGEIQNDLGGAYCLLCSQQFVIGEFIYNWNGCGSTHKNCYIGNKPTQETVSKPLQKPTIVTTISTMPKPIPLPKPIPKHIPDPPTEPTDFFAGFDDFVSDQAPWEKLHDEYINLTDNKGETFNEYLEQHTKKTS